MRGKAHIFHADGLIQTELLSASPTLEFLQKAVGGPIEAVPCFTTFNGKPAVAFCDEEGKLKGKPINVYITDLWYSQFVGLIDDVLVGDVVVLTGDEAFMDSL